MARPRKQTSDLASIQAERAHLETRLKELADRERLALEAAKDAGKETLLAALEKVRIPEMTKHEAKIIASGIARLGGPASAALFAPV